MKANELRIGNKIYGNYQREIDRGNGIVEDIECQDIVTFEGYDPIDNYFHISDVKIYDSLEPIPLTEEWLLKFGFVWELDKSYSLTINENFGLFIWVDLNTLHPIAELIDSGDRVVVNHIEYIHELQNLYFALTGEELKLLKDE